MAHSPYSGRPLRAFWRGGVAGNDPFPDDIYRPRFPITKETRMFTAGSCFAQHIGAALKDAGCRAIDTDPACRGMLDTTARRFGYGLYSARFGNIYTLRKFRQLIEEAIGQFTPACPVWENGGRFWDALRPGVEPEGVASPEIVAEMRKQHLGKVRAALAQTDVIVFTLGLTEAWEHREHDVAEWPIRRGLDLMSEAAFMHFMQEAIELRVAHLAHQFVGIQPLHAALAPFPTVALCRKANTTSNLMPASQTTLRPVGYSDCFKQP